MSSQSAASPAAAAASASKVQTPDIPAPSFREISNAIARVIVGPEEKDFLVHKAFLCHYSPYFDRAFNGNFIEGKSQTVKLLEEDAEAFGVFVDWVYTQKVNKKPTISNKTNPDTIFEKRMKLFVNVWCLADYLQAPALQNLVIDALIENENESLISPTCCLHLVYNRTPSKSVLRQLFVDMISRNLKIDAFNFEKKFWPPEMVMDLAITFKKNTVWKDPKEPMETPSNYYVFGPPKKAPK